jgi:hypothetical protein
MKNPTSSRFVLRATAAGALLLALSTVAAGVIRAAEKPAANSAASPLARELMGTWVHVGAPGKIGEAPAKGGFIKLRTATHWAAIAIDPRTGLVTSTHGGTWRVNGTEYQETTEYGGEYQGPLMGRTFKWTVKLEGDAMTKVALDNPWHEVWKRVK